VGTERVHGEEGCSNPEEKKPERPWVQAKGKSEEKVRKRGKLTMGERLFLGGGKQAWVHRGGAGRKSFGERKKNRTERRGRKTGCCGLKGVRSRGRPELKVNTAFKVLRGKKKKKQNKKKKKKSHNEKKKMQASPPCLVAKKKWEGGCPEKAK